MTHPTSPPPPHHHHASSRMITKPFLRYVTPDTDTQFIIYFSFLKLKKKQRYAPTNDTSTHVFKQLNQIVKFKQKRTKIELESLFSMNYLTRKKIKKFMCICQVLCIHPNRLYIVKSRSSRSVSDLWNIILNTIKVNIIYLVPFELLECHSVLKLFLIFFHIGEHFNTATCPF